LLFFFYEFGVLAIPTSRHIHRQASQQQGWADPMFGNNDFGIITQGIFDHLQLFQSLGVAYEILFGGFVDQPDGLRLALRNLNNCRSPSAR